MTLPQALIKRQAELVTEAVLTNDVARYKEITKLQLLQQASYCYSTYCNKADHLT
jgi:hypothetical protein